MKRAGPRSGGRSRAGGKKGSFDMTTKAKVVIGILALLVVASWANTWSLSSDVRILRGRVETLNSTHLLIPKALELLPREEMVRMAEKARALETDEIEFVRVIANAEGVFYLMRERQDD